MTLQYEPPRGFSSPQPARRARVRLNGRPHPKTGTSHQGPVWVALMSQRRAQAMAMHAQCAPNVKADARPSAGRSSLTSTSSISGLCISCKRTSRCIGGIATAEPSRERSKAFTSK